MKKTALIILVLLIGMVPLAAGFFHPGFFVSDDANWMIIRLSAFYSALSSGQFPTRFLPQLNNGYGYPVADFLYPLFLYIGSGIHVLKIPFILDIKLILFGSMLLSGWGMYLFLRKSFTSLAAGIGGILYVYLPYHLYDLYVRGSVGEVVALSIVPFLFWAVEKRSWVVVALFIGLLIPAHNTLALFFLPLVIIYSLLKGFSFKKTLLCTILGLGISAFFWLPALFDKQYTVFDLVSVSNPSSYFVNNVSFALLGWITPVILVSTLFIKNFYKNKVAYFFFALAAVSLFFSFSISNFFWHISVFSKFIQFPFRFLSILLISQSFLGAYIIQQFSKQKIIIVIFILLLVFSALPYLVPKQYSYNPESFYTTNQDTTTVQNEYMPKWAHNLPAAYPQKVSIPGKNGLVTNLVQKGTRLQFTAVMKQTAPAIVDFVYFPGWQAKLDGENLAVNNNKNGFLQLTVPQGNHTINVWFGETQARLVADIISLVSLIFLLGFWIKMKYEK